MRRPVLAVCGVLLGAPACVYYNAMWSAERFAKQARRAETRGEESEARGLWLRAAVKAESVHTRYPASRWADDALVLRTEALVRGGACHSAHDVLPRAQGAASDEPQRERVALAAAQCALQEGQPGRVAPLVEPSLQSRDAGRRSQAEYLAGRAAAARGDLTGAVEHLRASRERAAGPELVQVLLELGRGDEAVATLNGLASAPLAEAQWSALLDATARRLGPAPATAVLDRVLAAGRVPAPGRVRLTLADGDRLFAAGDYAAAIARYDAVLGATDRSAGPPALARSYRARAALAGDRAGLVAVRDSFDRAARRLGMGTEGPDARALRGALDGVLEAEATEAAEFRAAEMARDSLRAPRAASDLFLDFARRRPESLFAPKALVAALSGRPEIRDSVFAVLSSRYPDSPYTLALFGANSPTYAAAEDSLARALGLATARDRAAFVTLIAAPHPGPRGPWPDDVFPATAAVPPRDSVAVEPDDRAIPGRRQRPGSQPQTQPTPGAPRPPPRP